MSSQECDTRINILFKQSNAAEVNVVTIQAHKLNVLMLIITELSVESTLCLNPQKVTFDLQWALSMGKL